MTTGYDPNIKKRLVAVCASDIHLGKRPPLFRSVEEDWVETQRGYLRQLKSLCAPYKNRQLDQDPLPVLIPGDLFDQFGKDPHEIVNLAIKHLPTYTYGIYGNHDLLHHHPEDLHKTPYGVLVESKRIINVGSDEPTMIDGSIPIRLYGFPYGTEIKPLDKPNDFYLEIALIHDYVWTQTTGYEGAPEAKLLKNYREKLKGYDVVLFGDNHKTVEYNLDRSKPGPSIFNPGSFSIRKSDEKDHKPCVRLVYSDGSIEKHYLDISKDRYLETDKVVEATSGIGVSGFIEELLELGEHALDFGSFLTKLLERKKVRQEVKDWITKALDKENQK